MMENYGIVIILLLMIVAGALFYFFHRHYQYRIKQEAIRARKSEQLKSLFLANISRSLRTPMNAILGYSNMILEERDDNMHAGQVREMALQIKNNSRELLNFIAQLLELSNFEGNMPSFTPIEVNLAELMASYRREATNVISPDVSVLVRSDLSPHCKVTLDTNYMHQLMMHMLTEAAKHTSQGDITITYGYERKGLRVSIAYAGVGQAEMVGGDIYSFLQNEDVLQMTKGASGLGLSICKAIIDVLGGEFDLDTENGRKTVASFWFPCKMKDKHKES